MPSFDNWTSLRRDVVLFCKSCCPSVDRQTTKTWTICLWTTPCGAGASRAPNNLRCECRLANFDDLLVRGCVERPRWQERIAHGRKRVLDEEETTSTCT